MPTIDIDQFYTEQQAADVLGVNRITIWRLMKKGKIEGHNLWSVVLIPKSQIDSIKEAKEGKTRYD